jgi:hypothetical protein
MLLVESLLFEQGFGVRKQPLGQEIDRILWIAAVNRCQTIRYHPTNLLLVEVIDIHLVMTMQLH